MKLLTAHYKMKSADLIILGIVFGGLMVYYLIRFMHSYKLRKQNKRAKRGEKLAIAFLQQNGYTILAVQKRVPIVTKIDDRLEKNHVIADFIVKKDGKSYVVDVKTGKQVQRPTAADIRRQLLEYYLIYQTDGVLLLDMESKIIHNIEFQLNLFPSAPRYWSHFLAAIMGAVVVLIIFKGGHFF